MRLVALLLAALALLALPVQAAQRVVRSPVVIPVTPTGPRWRQQGAARFIQAGSTVKIIVLIGNTPLNVPQKVQIFRGHCDVLGGPLYTLGDLHNGYLSAEITQHINELTFHSYALVVTNQSGDRVACGNII